MNITTKKIWMYWHQGWDEAPDLVKQCRQSWKKFNPEYEVIALHKNTLFDYIDFPREISFSRKDMPIQKVSNLIRLALLSAHGGVWVDGTVMCSQPLSGWLENYYSAGFFAFRNPGKDRLLSTWFMASEQGNLLLQKLYENYSALFVNNFFSNENTAIGDKLHEIFECRWNLSVKSSLKWHSWFARKILRIYPYFIFHYTFNKLVLEDPEYATLWAQVKPFSADFPHFVQFHEGEEWGLVKAKKHIDSRVSPLHKLNWRVDTSTGYWRDILSYLNQNS